MSDIGVGKLIDQHQNRDAIHVAVAPVMAVEELAPGQHVGFLKGSNTEVQAGGERIGIIDPFLTESVQPRQRCWMFLYPGTITSLRHDWTHPAFQASVSEVWLRVFAESNGMSLSRLMDAAERWVTYEDYTTGGSELEGAYVPGEFWPHYEAYTGKTVQQDKKSNFFNCSC